MDNVLVGQHARLRTGALARDLASARDARGGRAAREWAMEIFSIFGNRLTPRIEQMVAGLSYANRRRIEIARALASRPRILLLDEPTAGMNPAETLELAEQIKSLHELGLTVLLIEHKLDVVTTLADTVFVLDHGEVIAQGKPDEVRRNEEVLRAYLGPQPRRRRACGGWPSMSPDAHCMLRIQGRQHLLRRPARPEGRQLRDRAGRDRFAARRQCLRQVDHDEDDHGRGAADARHGDLRGRRRSSACPPPSACAAASPRCWRRAGCSRA